MLPDLPHSFETDQGIVRYDVKGSGPELVLVHGTPWSAFSYSKLLAGLVKDYRVLLYDLIGYGQSEMRNDQRVSLDVQAEVFAGILNHLNFDNPYVVAHDFGGAISLRTHLLHGKDYRKLVFMNVVAMAPWGSPFFAHVRSHEAAFSGVPAYIHEAILKRYIEGALHQTLPDAELRALMEPWLSQTGQAAFYRQIAQADQKYTDEVEPLYEKIRCPVRILWGEDDDWIPIETGRRLSAAIGQSDFHSISNAGHLVQFEQPQIVVDFIREFMS